jgi:hypothetical protein
MILALICVAVNTGNISAWTTPAAPTLVNANPSGAEGDWYIGAIPPGYDPSKPVLVFVQGLHGNATNWWGATAYYGNNDMYAYAYNYGYRTAFVNFRDADGNAGSMWLNGSDLRNQLQRICAYFGVPKVNMICHSKGGIDTQSAIVHYGAYPYVDKVFTLSSPHWGSQLADLSYSWYASWLGALLGQQDDGTYVLQTSYMSYFRSITDSRSENDGVKYYTSAGTDWGPLFSALYFGGVYLSGYGSNDGLVTVTSAHNPRATHINTSSYNHDNIRIGSKVWWYVEPQIRSYSVSLAAATLKTAFATAISSLSMDAGSAATANSTDETPEQPGNYLLRGGELNPGNTATVPVESGVDAVLFDLMVADPMVNIKIIAPGGSSYWPEATYKDSEYFSGATHFTLKINRPAAGTWQIIMESQNKNAFLLIAGFDSPLRTKLNARQRRLRTKSPLDLSLEFSGMGNRKFKKINGSAMLCRVNGRGRIHKFAEEPMNNQGAKFGRTFTMPQEPGLYNVNFNITGVLDDGTVFERSQVYSVVVDSDELNGEHLLKNIAGQQQ